jgi:hypothetical protein
MCKKYQTGPWDRSEVDPNPPSTTNDRLHFGTAGVQQRLQQQWLSGVEPGLKN